MADDRKTDELVDRLLARKNKVSRSELRQLITMAQELGGEFVQASSSGGDEPDDWCGTMWFKKPRPKVGPLIDSLLESGWVVEVFPYGIPVIDQLRLDVRNQAFGKR